ncbi:Zinc finger protein [Pseudolycoriella hygida]|uniref:Zinc finger protein n=1 Tax=Pseudolycoriella hygida TaxID=35572 RepID=A0A9Q0RUJ1_9DIPT|nr:Zinc finger protein [Pseudolycoriella hygida]
MASTKDRQKLTEMCRLCMDRNVPLVDLQSEKGTARHSANNILDSIEEFTTVKIDLTDDLPNKICESCVHMVNSMVAFRNKCRESNEEFHKRLREDLVDIVKKEILDTNANESEFMLWASDDNKETVAEHDTQDAGEEIVAKRSRLEKVACHICGKLYDVYRLKFHLNKHNGLKPYECDEANCTSKFSDPHDLNKHKKLCHFLKPVLCCDVCGRGFKVKVGLEMHRSYHFDPKLPCKICEKLFRNTRALNKHMLVHSQERKFKCETCGKSYQTRYTLRIHKRVHTNEKPYQCHCGVSFAYKCLLKAHNEKHHK